MSETAYYPEPERPGGAESNGDDPGKESQTGMYNEVEGDGNHSDMEPGDPGDQSQS